MDDNSGIRLKASHELLRRQIRGRANLGLIKQDQKNYLRSKRMKSLQYGKARNLLLYFMKQLTGDPSFVYDLQMDNEGQVTNIFWANAKMIVDYKFF